MSEFGYRFRRSAHFVSADRAFNNLFVRAFRLTSCRFLVFAGRRACGVRNGFARNVFSADFRVTYRAVHNAVIRTGNGTGSVYDVFLNGSLGGMTESIDSFRFSAYFFSANRTFNYFVVRTRNRTSRGYFIFADCVRGSVSDFIYDYRRKLLSVFSEVFFTFCALSVSNVSVFLTSSRLCGNKFAEFVLSSDFDFYFSVFIGRILRFSAYARIGNVCR